MTRFSISLFFLCFIYLPNGSALELDERYAAMLEEQRKEMIAEQKGYLRMLESQSKFINKKREAFVRNLLLSKLGIASCRTDFKLYKSILRWVSKGDMLVKDDYELKMKKWAEPDAREPGLINHITQWEYPGNFLETSTHFMKYGLSTWLSRFKITSSNITLPYNLKVGMPAKIFAKNLDINDSSKIGFMAEHGHVEIKSDSLGNVQAVIITCIAD